MELATAIPAELTAAAAKVGLALADSAAIAEAFAPHFIAFREAADRAAQVPDTDDKTARKLRLELKATRVASESTRKRLKEHSLRTGQAIDGIQKVLEHALVPVEEAMAAIEQAEERRIAAAKAALQAERAGLLAPFAKPEFYADLGTMPTEQWESLLANAKTAHEAVQAAAVKAEADRVAAAKAEAERVAALAAENARLAAEAAEARAAAAKVQAAADAEAARVKALADAEAAAAKAKADAAAAVAKAETDRIAAELAKVQAEARAAEAVRLAKEAAAEQERREAEAAQEQDDRIAAAAPDREKLAAFACAIRALPVPALSSEAGAATAMLLADQVEKFAQWVEKKAASL